ncbi:MAG: hypothetical protein HY335_00040 [Deinococcus sp.]|nr:hypothetical protein [Deinococcus sp.]
MKGPPQGGGRPPKPAEQRRRTMSPWLTDDEFAELKILAIREKKTVVDLVSELIRERLRQAKTAQ